SSSRSWSGLSGTCSRRPREAPRRRMTDKSPPEPVSSLLDRLFLYGTRSVLIVLAVAALGAFLIVHGALVTRYDYIASGVVIVLIAVGLTFAFQATTTQIITQRYFATDLVPGKDGVANVGAEDFTAQSDEFIAKGSLIRVTGYQDGKVRVATVSASPPEPSKSGDPSTAPPSTP